MIKSKIQKRDYKNDSKNVLIRFLKQTKEGKFASVEKSNLKYSRLNEKFGNVDLIEDIYYYNLS